jgi:hypothetical protein
LLLLSSPVALQADLRLLLDHREVDHRAMAERRVTTAGEEVSQQPQRGHPSEYILYDDHEISVLAGPDPTAAESWEAVVVRSCIRVTCANDADECELSLLVLGDNGERMWCPRYARGGVRGRLHD